MKKIYAFLIVAVVVVGVFVAAIYYSSYISYLPPNYRQGFRIIGVVWNVNANAVEVAVQNIGREQVTLDKVLLDGVSVENATFSPGRVIQPDQTCQVYLPVEQPRGNVTISIENEFAQAWADKNFG